MFNREFYYWCRDAVSKIRYSRDRNRVFRELYEHMEDRYASFIARGLSHEEAEKRTVEAMGDAKALAPQLAAIHKPWWGYASVITRLAAIVAFFFCISRGVNYFLELDLYQKAWDHYTQESGERIAYVTPEVSDSSDGYTFTVKKAALWRNWYEAPTDESGAYGDSLFVQLSVTNPLPWAAEQQGVYRMWAVDSSGTYYASNEAGASDCYISVTTNSTGIFTYCYDLYFQGTAEDIQWVELHYDRDGRDVLLRIDLTEGGAS